MRPLILLLAFALSGCWEGTNLYAERDAQPALAAGSYKFIEPDGKATIVKVSSSPSGMTSVEMDGDASLVGFVPLDATDRTFVMWSAEKGTQSYELAVRQPDSSIIFYVPSCEGEQAEIARNAGAVVEPGMVPTCKFANRAGLENAMRHLRPKTSQEAFRIVSMGK